MWYSIFALNFHIVALRASQKGAQWVRTRWKGAKKCKTSHYAQFNRLGFFSAYIDQPQPPCYRCQSQFELFSSNQRLEWMNTKSETTSNSILSAEHASIYAARLDHVVGSRFWVCSSHTCCAILLKDQIKINKIWSASSDRFLFCSAFFFCNTAQYAFIHRIA